MAGKRSFFYYVPPPKSWTNDFVSGKKKIRKEIWIEVYDFPTGCVELYAVTKKISSRFLRASSTGKIYSELACILFFPRSPTQEGHYFLGRYCVVKDTMMKLFSSAVLLLLSFPLQLAQIPDLPPECSGEIESLLPCVLQNDCSECLAGFGDLDFTTLSTCDDATPIYCDTQDCCPDCDLAGVVGCLETLVLNTTCQHDCSTIPDPNTGEPSMEAAPIEPPAATPVQAPVAAPTAGSDAPTSGSSLGAKGVNMFVAVTVLGYTALCVF